jgi:tetratricopeptide (TPR) repeat protein
MSSIFLLAAMAAAATPELVVVGAHLPGLAGGDAEAASRRLVETLDATGKVDAVSPGELRGRIDGRESLVLEGYALGPGRDALREGRVLYDRAQPDQAIPSLEQAARLLAAGLASASDARDLQETLLLLGLAHAGLGDENAARLAFRRAVVLDPTRQLDPVNYPPQIVAMHEFVRAAATAETPGTLSIISPQGARVWVDGRAVLGGADGLRLIAGDHYVLVRADDGASWFDVVKVVGGDNRRITPSLAPRAVGRAATDAAGRSRQTRDLYRSLGEHTDQDPILLAGTTSTGQVAVQLYAPLSGNFSRALMADAGADPVDALLTLLPAAVGFLNENGDIKSDRVSPQVLSLDVGANDSLASLLLDPEPSPAGGGSAPPSAARKPAPWYLWAGLGVVVAGGGATAAALLLTEEDPAGGGTITFGPIP